MNQKNKFRFCAALIAASSLQQAFAGDLLGTVIDTELNEPLYGAVVKIQNSNTGAVADLNGKFSLRNLKKKYLYAGSILFIFRNTGSKSRNSSQRRSQRKSMDETK